MSFGFPSRNLAIQKAIQTTSSNVLMFAAGSNRGKTSKPTFPANESSVICIWATDGDGNKSLTNAQTMSGSGKFATLGVAVKSAWPEQPQHPDVTEIRKSGTSFATPIAAGIAACVLEFAIQNGMDKNYYDELKSHQGMRKVFQSMKTKSDGLHFIYPWELFHEKVGKVSIRDTLVKIVSGT